MNSLLSLLLAGMTFLASFFSLFYPVKDIKNVEDDFVPVVRFLAMSDTHYKFLGDKATVRVAKAIKYGYEIAEKDKDYNKLDAVCFTGDITNKGIRSQFLTFTACKNAYIKDETKTLALCAKAHDCSRMGKDALDYFSKVTGLPTDYHYVINGFHFIGLSTSKGEEHYSEAQVKWLDEQLKIATNEDASKPVFVFQHEHIANTVYGSSSFDGWGVSYFTKVLNKYPQVVDISGHSHYPANDPRTIWQGVFTAINDGGLNYYEFTVDGERCVHPYKYNSQAQALIVEVDKNNRVLVRVLDVQAGEFVEEFLIDNITEKNKTKYSFEKRKNDVDLPKFDSNVKVKSTKLFGKLYLNFPVAKASEGDKIFIYRATVYDGKTGDVVSTGKTLSQYYLANQNDNITISCPIKSGKYRVEIVAEDVWGKQSEPLVINVG